jgi:hypothetical protein
VPPRSPVAGSSNASLGYSRHVPRWCNAHSGGAVVYVSVSDRIVQYHSEHPVTCDA